MSEKIWHLKNCDLFERLSPDELATLERSALARKYPRGGLIYLPRDAGDSVLLLAAGRVKITNVTGEGKQAILTLIEPGELFGELAAIDAADRDEFAEAMQASTVILIPAEQMQALMQAHPDVTLGVTKLIGLRRRRIERRLKHLLFRSNRERLVHLLLELVEQYGVTDSRGVAVGIKLSHQDLASIIGSTRESVTVLLGELQLARLIKVDRRRIVVLDLDALAACVEAPVPQTPLPAQRNGRDNLNALSGSPTRLPEGKL